MKSYDLPENPISSERAGNWERQESLLFGQSLFHCHYFCCLLHNLETHFYASPLSFFEADEDGEKSGGRRKMDGAPLQLCCRNEKSKWALDGPYLNCTHLLRAASFPPVTVRTST